MVGALQTKIRCLRCDRMAALEIGNRATTVAKHAGRARSTGKKEDQLSQDSSPRDTAAALQRLGVLSHPNRGTSREGEASIALSHRDEAPAPLTWWDGTNDLRTCLMIVETTDGADRLTNLRHRR